MNPVHAPRLGERIEANFYDPSSQGTRSGGHFRRENGRAVADELPETTAVALHTALQAVRSRDTAEHFPWEWCRELRCELHVAWWWLDTCRSPVRTQLNETLRAVTAYPW